MTDQGRQVASAREGRSQRGWDAPLFVWGAWCLAVVAAVVFAFHGRRFPYTDDWSLVPVLTGAEPVTFSWLWSQHNVHRILLPRVVFLALYNPMMGYDFRSGVVFNALVLSILALAMLVAVKRLRGWTTYSDAFFPLALLHWGIDALNWNFGLQFLCSMALGSSFMLLIVRDGAFSTLASGLLAGLLVLLLPTTGANGLALAPCLVLFLGYSAFRQWQQKTPASVRAAVVMVSFGIGCLLLSGLYFVGYTMPGPSEYTSRGIGSTLKTALIFSAAGLGPGVSAGLDRWPWWEWWSVVVPALVTATVVLLIRRVFTNRSELGRIVGFLLFLAALVMLAVAVGHGRGGLAGVDRSVAAAHYNTLALPILCFVYFVWEAYGPPPAKRLVEMCLFCVMCAAFILNGPPMRYLGGWNMAAAELQKDVLAGMSRCAVTERHLRLFWWQDTQTSWGRAHGEKVGKATVSNGLEMLGRVGVEPFRLFRDDPSSNRNRC